MKKICWGILSTAKIAREKVIPALQKAENCEVVAIASRNIDLAKATAIQLNIARAYGSYEALMEDREIDAVYIPLPNHLHVPWTVNALAANKHVLCEKPIALSAIEAKELYDFAKQKPQLKIMEAFMYRFHPQWAYIKKLIDDGAIGQLKSMQSLFSYFNMDGNNIRNKKEIGGGGLMDIGCYCISLSRYLFNEEPTSVSGNIIYDPQFHIDNLASGILNFSTGAAVFSCATQLAPCQFANIIGTEARIEVEIPFTPQHDTAARIRLHKNNIIQDIIFETADQYTLQCKLFSQAIIDNTDVPASLMDAVNNMKVLDAIVKSGKEGKLIKIE